MICKGHPLYSLSTCHRPPYSEVESIALGSVCKVRKIFTLRTAPMVDDMDDASTLGGAMDLMEPIHRHGREGPQGPTGGRGGFPPKTRLFHFHPDTARYFWSLSHYDFLGFK